jgi:hypothetical protein
MSAYKFYDPLIGQPVVSGTGTWGTAPGQAAPLPFGFIGEAVDPTYGYAEFVFVKGPASGSSAAAGDAVQILPNFAVQQLASGSTATQGPVGIAPAALSATNVYGWVQVMGVCDYAKMGTQGTAAVGLPVVIGSTAGRLQSTAGATGYIINGLKVSQYSTTANSNSAVLGMYYPIFDGRNQ